MSAALATRHTLDHECTQNQRARAIADMEVINAVAIPDQPHCCVRSKESQSENLHSQRPRSFLAMPCRIRFVEIGAV